MDGRQGERRAGRSRVVAGLVALEQLPGALGTAVLALGVLLLGLVAATTSLVGVGLLAVPTVLRGLHAVADRERARLGRWGGEVVSAGARPERLRQATTDRVTRRELRWLVGHATGGLLLSAIAVLLPLYALRDLSFPLWWRLLPLTQRRIH